MGSIFKLSTTSFQGAPKVALPSSSISQDEKVDHLTGNWYLYSENGFLYWGNWFSKNATHLQIFQNLDLVKGTGYCCFAPTSPQEFMIETLKINNKYLSSLPPFLYHSTISLFNTFSCPPFIMSKKCHIQGFGSGLILNGSKFSIYFIISNKKLLPYSYLMASISEAKRTIKTGS